MKVFAALVWATLLVLPAPVLGQTSEAGVPVLDDGTGDPQVRAGDTGLGSTAGRFAAADLKSLLAAESANDFTFTLGVASLATGNEIPGLESSSYQIYFAYGSIQYRLVIYRMTFQEAEYWGSLQIADEGRGGFQNVVELPVLVDEGAATMTVAVPRSFLLDIYGGNPQPGQSLQGFRVVATSLRTGGGGQIGGGPVPPQRLPMPSVEDRMPDQGNGTLDVLVTLGIQQTGHARLLSDVPVRASNGEATTFVFQVKGLNLGETKDRFQVTATGVPGTWQVRIPTDVVEIDAGGELLFPVLVTMPFAHAHATLQTFLVEMTSLSDPSAVGRVKVGVRFNAVPQPAGHHETLYLHTNLPEDDPTFSNAFGTALGEDFNSLYFNTVDPADDANDAKTPVGGSICDSGLFAAFDGGTPAASMTYCWITYLAPTLQMGLDFDLTRTGDITVPVSTVLPMPGATLSGFFVYIPPKEERDGRFLSGDDWNRERAEFYNNTVIARIVPGAPVDVGANTPETLLTGTVEAMPGGDYIPFQPGASMGLMLNVSFTRADPFIGPKDFPKINPGTSMRMPLLEYHDPVDQVFTTLASLMLHAEGPQERLVNPGETVLFNARLMNHAEVDGNYEITIDGTNAPWARVLGETKVSLGTGQDRPLVVAVTVPPDAPDGERADLVLDIKGTGSNPQHALARIVAVVDTDADHDDESNMVPGLQKNLSDSKGAPGLGLVSLLVGLALLATWRRRR